MEWNGSKYLENIIKPEFRILDAAFYGGMSDMPSS